jgi:hypothetical protein
MNGGGGGKSTRVDAAALYGNGAVIGLSPREVDATSFWQLLAAIEGFAAANTPSKGPKAPAKPGSHGITPEMMDRWRNGE